MRMLDWAVLVGSGSSLGTAAGRRGGDRAGGGQDVGGLSAVLEIHCISKRDPAMKVELAKWGNSLAVRIPKAFAEEARMRNGTAVNLTLEKGRVVVAPLLKREPSLKDLLAKVDAAVHEAFY